MYNDFVIQSLWKKSIQPQPAFISQKFEKYRFSDWKKNEKKYALTFYDLHE